MSLLRRIQVRSQGGFTLVEILVVVLIAGMLAAIALPAFLNQRAKSQDAETKVYLVAAQKALEIWHMQHDTYDGADIAELERIDPALGRAINPAIEGDEDTFTVAFDSASGASGGGRFTLARTANEKLTRSCANAGKGACSGTNSW